MSEILEKVSSYNIFTNLLPGIIFCFVADKYLSYPLIQEDMLIGIFLYYFVGLVISRVGSLFVEPFLKMIGLLKYSDYISYVKATENDEKIEQLLETNNVYRSATSLFLCVSLLIAFDLSKTRWPTIDDYAVPAVCVFMLALFVFSYVKQSSYIRKRVDIASSDKKEE